MRGPGIDVVRVRHRQRLIQPARAGHHHDLTFGLTYAWAEHFATGHDFTGLRSESNADKIESYLDDWGNINYGAMGSGDDIGAACVYLASKEAGYVTGQTLHVNGGMAMI